MLQIRYHKNFNGIKQVFLFAGSADDLNWFRSVINDWRGERVDLISKLKLNHKVFTHGIKKLLIEIDGKNATSIYGVDGSDAFLLLTEKDKNKIVGLLEGLESFDGSGHQYLSSKGQIIELMFSKDEYGLSE